MTDDSLKTYGLGTPPPESCYKCAYSRTRHTSCILMLEQLFTIHTIF